MSIKDQGHSLTLVRGHSDFKVKCLTFGLYTHVSDSGPIGPLVSIVLTSKGDELYKLLVALIQILLILVCSMYLQNLLV